MVGFRMSCRKWLVRGLVFSALGGMILTVLIYEAWTCPSAMRTRVLAKLSARFVGATVAVESAHLRLLGGTAVREVRLARRGGMDNRDLLYVPSGVIYHDKERLLDGTLALRKMELDRPVFRVSRSREGKFNWEGVLGPVDLNERVPTIVARHGTLLIEDAGSAPGNPVLEIRDLSLTMVNDPIEILVIEAVGRSDVAGPVKIGVRISRRTDAGTATVEMPGIPVNPTLVKRLSALRPELETHFSQLTAVGSIRAAFSFQPGVSPAVHYDVTAALHDGTFAHPRLPVRLQQVEASVRCVDGAVPVARLNASFDGPHGPGKIETAVRDLALPLPDAKSVSQEPEDFAREADVKIEHLVIGEELLGQLPDPAPEIVNDYHPDGPVTVCCAYRREAPGSWHKDWVIQPQAIRGRFHKFPYDLENVSGTIEMTTRSDHNTDATVKLRGYSAGRPVSIKGEIHGPKATSAIDFEVAADSVPLDRKLFDALPSDGAASARSIARQFLPHRSRELGLDRAPAGVGDIRATILRRRGHNEFENHYLVTVRDAALQYDLFPLPLEHATAVLDIRPHDWECRGFRAEHGGGEIRVECHSEPALQPCSNPVPGRTDRILVEVRGRDIPIDREFEQALAPPMAPGRAMLQKTFQTLGLGGKISFGARVEDRPGQPQDFDATVAVRGCSMKPAFFRYAMSDVGGTVRYIRNRSDEHRPDHVYLADLTARHGATLLGMGRGEIMLKPNGGYYGTFDDVRGSALRADGDLLAALPPTVRRGLDALQLETPIDVETKLKVDAPADPLVPPVIWWDGGAHLRDARLKTGVELSGVEGYVYCCGSHDGHQLDQGLLGNILLSQVNVFGQPVRNLRGHFEISPKQPERLCLRDLNAELFAGNVGGEAKFDFGSTLRYEVVLQALGIDLEKFGRHNLGPKVELQGPATASLAVWGEGSDISGLKGNGNVGVASGKLYHLPVLLDLIKAFGLRLPDRTAFEQAHLDFGIEGERVQVRTLELYGNAISLRGQGTMNINGGDLNLDFNADWARFGQVLPTGISALPRAISDQLLKIKLRGSFGSPRFEKELVPGVVEPVKRVLGGGGV
jgi:hypothetical protein